MTRFAVMPLARFNVHRTRKVLMTQACRGTVHDPILMRFLAAVDKRCISSA
ncbi:hypothetical protein J2R87_004552 [Bradyrhizobium elkanii]|nr:hypothetical protein [Bradyrhizobium elkanii]MCS4107681.1 hypothetical protein [Bradyrhizobium elkanii]